MTRTAAHRHLAFFVTLCAGAASAIGLSVLIGWAADITVLKSVVPGLITMKPNAAMAFLLCGLGLLSAVDKPDRWSTRFMALAVMAIGGATLAEYISGWDFGIDELLFKEPKGAYASLVKSRMHPTTAFSFFIMGLGLSLLDWSPSRRFRPSQVAASIVLGISLCTLLCYIFGIREFVGISRVSQMALHTTIGLILLCIGTLAVRPETGFMPVIMRPDNGALVARPMLLAALIIPLTVGAITLLSIRVGLFGNELGLAAQVVVTAASFSVFVLNLSKAMATADRARDRMAEDLQLARQDLEVRVEQRTAELETVNRRLHDEITERQQGVEALRQSEEKIRSLIASANAGIVTSDHTGCIRSWNRGAVTIFGYSEQEAIGQPLTILMPESMHELHRAGLQRFVATGEARLLGTTVVVSGRRKDGSEVPIELSLATWKSGGQDYFSGIIVDISDRKRAEAELVAAKETAEAAARVKADFLATMSHEIRTPMNGILGMIGFLLDSQLQEEQRNFAETARTSAESLLVVINDILDFSKIEAGKLDIEEAPYDVQTAAEEVLDLLADRVEAKGIDLVLRIPPKAATQLLGDAGRVRQILLNLVGNAVKFTAQGVVAVSIAFDDPTAPSPRVRFTVIDTGMGIPVERQSALFEKFTQADVSTTRKFGGTGLGLAISRRLVELMGGAIGFTSELGHGSTFWFDLPLRIAGNTLSQVVTCAPISVLWLDASPATAAWASSWLIENGARLRLAATIEDFTRELNAPEVPDLVVIDTAIVKWEEAVKIRRGQPLWTRVALLCRMPQRQLYREWRQAGFSALLSRPLRPSLLSGLIRGDRVRLDTPSSEAIVSHPQYQGRILLAEDNIINQRVAVRMLERFGLRIDVAANGLEAVALASRLPYDLVFMDCQMPEMDGFAATAAIRRLDPTRHVPIIALTANAISDDRQRCLDAGMDDYVSKPVRFDELKRIVKRWIRPSEAEV